MEMKVIAHIRSDFPTKFGIPHQSGRIQELKADIIFEPEYRNHEAFRGLEEYTHIWLIWEFSQAVRSGLLQCVLQDLGETSEWAFLLQGHLFVQIP